MFRLIVLLLLGMGIAAPSSAADYEINLSALDALETSDADFELPLPVVKKKTAVSVQKKLPPKKPAVRVKKSVEPVVKTRSVRKTPAPVQKPKKEEAPAVTEEQKTLPAEEPVKTAAVVPAAEPVVENVPAAVEQPAAEQNDNEKSITEKSAAEIVRIDDVRQNVVPESPKTPVSSFDNREAVLVFDDESSELNAGIIKALTELTGRIETENPGKITIEAYNYDDGEGSFSRKRLSLNRAVAVRSWLLGKGCKSFGIKIINTEDVSLRNNILVSL